MSSYTRRIGLATDRWLNVVLWGGNLDDTVSAHAARDALAGKRTGCVVCKLLHVLVETNHCQKSLDDTSKETASAPVRAALLIGIVIFLLHVIFKQLLILLMLAGA